MAQQRIYLLASLIQYFKQTDSALVNEQITKRVILLMGETKAGKTTLLYYLLGKQLIWLKNDIDVWQMRPQATYFDAVIGNGYQSTTVYPNISLNEHKDEVTIIDMPGFDDTRPQFRLLNLYTFHKAIQLIKNVHICLVIPEESLNSNDIFRQIQKLSKLFNKSFLTTSLNMSFIVTKCQNQTENQIYEILKSGLQQILTEDISEDLVDIIRIIINNKAYYFANKQPLVKQGLLLRSKIINQNSFFEIENNKTKLISQHFHDVMIGETNIEEFQNYLKQILKIIGQIFLVVFYLVQNVIKISFLDIFSYFQGIQSEEMATQLHRNINQLLQSCPYQPIKSLTYKPHIRKELTKITFLNIHKVFQIYRQQLNHRQLNKKDQIQANMYYQYLTSLRQIMHLCHYGSTQKDDIFFVTLQQSLRYFKTIIETIIETKRCSNEQIIQNLIIRQQIFKSVETILAIWDDNVVKIVQIPAFIAIAEDQQIVKCYGELGCVEVEEIVEVKEKISILTSIRDIHTFQSLLNLCQTNKSNENTEEKEITLNIQCNQNIKQKLQQLPNDYKTLNQLLNQLSCRQQRHYELLALKNILSKISNIFLHYSFYEQAIVFRMSFHDYNGVDMLFKLGANSQQVSLHFIKEIMIPFYGEVRPSVEKIEEFFNYIDMMVAGQDVCGMELEMVSVLERIKRRLQENRQIVHMFKVEWSLIRFLIEEREAVCSQVRKRQLLYEKSFIKQLRPYIFKKLNP